MRISDWSSDVCSSALSAPPALIGADGRSPWESVLGRARLPLTADVQGISNCYMPSQVARSTPRSAGSPPRRRSSTGPLRQLPLPGEHAVDVGLVPLECADERRVLRMAELVLLNLAEHGRAPGREKVC